MSPHLRHSNTESVKQHMRDKRKQQLEEQQRKEFIMYVMFYTGVGVMLFSAFIYAMWSYMMVL